MRIQPELRLCSVVCELNPIIFATSLTMSGIKLTGQLVGVQGATFLDWSEAVPKRGRGVAPPKPEAKLQSRLFVRSSRHSCARAEIATFQKFHSPAKVLGVVFFRSWAAIPALEQRSRPLRSFTLLQKCCELYFSARAKITELFAIKGAVQSDFRVRLPDLLIGY